MEAAAPGGDLDQVSVMDAPWDGRFGNCHREFCGSSMAVVKDDAGALHSMSGGYCKYICDDGRRELRLSYLGHSESTTQRCWCLVDDQMDGRGEAVRLPAEVSPALV
jgi:hypothetical protein